MAMKKGLGKGLDSMIPEKKTKAELSEAADKSFLEIKISEIDPNMGQPRKRFDEDELLELSESIKIHGVIQPIILTKRGKRYEIIAGERRWRASKLAGLTKIPAVIREYTDKEIMEVSLIENIQRQDLNPVEEAEAFKNLIDEYKMKQDDLAERVSKSRSAITNALRLLKLDDRVKSMLAEGLISPGHARALLAVEDKNKQHNLATRIFDEKLSVRETEKLVKHILENKVVCQRETLNKLRKKSSEQKEAIRKLDGYIDDIRCYEGDLDGLLGYEGSAARIYFRNFFDNVEWKGRQPRVKVDYINSTLDIGYTVLFNIIDAMLRVYGFDTYYGVLHRQFYMRKSLVCDIMEPFRPLIDAQVRKAINLQQCKEEDFELINGQYLLKWKMNGQYIKFLTESILERKNEIFLYVQQFYRSMMKGKSPGEYPVFVQNP